MKLTAKERVKYKNWPQQTSINLFTKHRQLYDIKLIKAGMICLHSCYCTERHKNCTLLIHTVTLQTYIILWKFWHIDAHDNIPSPTCLTVFVKSKTENQLIRFVIAYLVADNNVKCETAAATRDHRLHHSWLPNSPDLDTVYYYRICGVLQ